MKWIDRVYRVPNELRSYEDARRLRHQDIGEIPTPMLAREKRRVELRLMLSDPSDDWGGWCEERILVIESELAGRRSAPVHTATRQQHRGAVQRREVGRVRL